MEDEEILDYCMTKNWAWVATDDRLVKYRKSDGGVESLSDVSYNEISGISMEQNPYNAAFIGYGVFGILIALVLFFGALPILAGVVALISAFLMWKGFNGGSSYFELKGTGLLRQEPEEWRIEKTSGENDEIREFIKTVRGQI